MQDIQPVLNSSLFKGGADDRLGFLLDAMQVIQTDKALGVDLVYIFRAGGTGGKPTILGDNLETANCGIVARRPGEPGQNFLICQGRGLYILRG